MLKIGNFNIVKRDITHVYVSNNCIIVYLVNMQKVVIEPFIETINELLQTNGFIAANAKNYVNPVNILKFTCGYKR